MSSRLVWVQGEAQQSGAGSVRTWHLEGIPGETICGKKTLPMKSTPKAEWDQVLNPCSECQEKAEASEVHEIRAS